MGGQNTLSETQRAKLHQARLVLKRKEPPMQNWTRWIHNVFSGAKAKSSWILGHYNLLVWVTSWLLVDHKILRADLPEAFWIRIILPTDSARKQPSLVPSWACPSQASYAAENSELRWTFFTWPCIPVFAHRVESPHCKQVSLADLDNPQAAGH